jgi:hypothetical protein
LFGLRSAATQPVFIVSTGYLQSGSLELAGQSSLDRPPRASTAVAPKTSSSRIKADKNFRIFVGPLSESASKRTSQHVEQFAQFEMQAEHNGAFVGGR